MYDLDRIKCERVLVRRSGSVNWSERILLCTNTDDSCTCVTNTSERDFLNGKIFAIVNWEHYKPIPAKIYRVCTSEELLELKDNWFRMKPHPSIQSRVTSCGVKAGTLFIGGTWYDEVELFKGYEVLVEGTWQPVGVLDEK